MGGEKKQFRTRAGKDQPRVPSREHIKKKGRSPVLICPKCHAVYFDKHWHSNKFLSQAYKWNLRVEYVLCSEDKLIKAGKKQVDFGGEVLFYKIPKNKMQEIVQQIRNIGKRGRLRDPQDKIIKIEVGARQIRVLTTENQLAVSIGKQIDRAHKGGELKIKWSHKDKPARVVWEYKNIET